MRVEKAAVFFDKKSTWYFCYFFSVIRRNFGIFSVLPPFMVLVVKIPVFEISDRASLKPVSPATETI